MTYTDSESAKFWERSNTSGCSGVAVEYRTRNRDVAGSTHTQSTASNLEQVESDSCKWRYIASVQTFSRTRINNEIQTRIADHLEATKVQWPCALSYVCGGRPVVKKCQWAPQARMHWTWHTPDILGSCGIRPTPGKILCTELIMRFCVYTTCTVHYTRKPPPPAPKLQAAVNR